MSQTGRIAVLLVAGGVFLLCAIFVVLAVLLMRQLSGLCEPMAAADLTSPEGGYEANVVRDDCDRNAGLVYRVRIARDADGFEEPGVKPAAGGEAVPVGDDVRVRWASEDELVISGPPDSNVNVVLSSPGVAVRREVP